MKKPRRSGVEMPKIVPVGEVPGEVARALFALLAYACNQSTPMIEFNLKGLLHGDLELGDFEVRVTKVD